MLAAFPEQWQVLQRVQARGVGVAQAQGGFTGLLQVELAEGRQHWLQAAERQCDLQGAVSVRAVRDIHQNQLVVATPGQALRVENLGVRTHQVQQDRQQAQALTVDDDPQFQVEPVTFRRLVDRGVPVIDGRQVEPEVFVDLQFPALGAQLGQLIEGKGQPGAVIDHLIEFAGTFRQGLALAGGDFETEGAQLFPVDLFDFRVTFYPQRLRLLTNQDVGVLLSADVFIQVAEGQRCAVLDVALHLAVARFEGAELDAGQPQARHRLYGVDQLLRERCGCAVFQDGLELFQQLQVCGGRRVLQGVLDFEQHRRAMLAVHPYRATAQGVDQQQCVFG
ncbi:hypothetical protein D3C78_894020 [compost metagenome]